ncbi:putative disease resistance RPP13-like protein 1 isoform X2 [Carya illinoinensis]|uniref:putative disease resistance RPP13-like protein 1 isoform X1 n=1 Tax=Carya illinoinensis TaxID=32201 RepID=UPI001C7252BC|nr:putative disease resistance RPP13-like protein 1 isoform X1 [Carya illinoinensis]XP_042957024.1 putative disease resistance RPP13-like protein 1 isoform X2 [Carya illinoinensis]
MAGALVGGAFLSAFLQVLFDRMATPKVLDLFRWQKLTKNLLRKLEIALQSMNTVLEDAEDKQLTMPSVRTWLDGLIDAVYDAEDIVDDIFTKALRHELDAEFQIAANKVRNHISLSLFVNKIEREIKELLERLEFLALQKDFIGLRAGVGGNLQERLPTTSLVEESGIFDRDDDKEAIVNLLLSGDSSGNEMSLIAIVGMGGIGKTTLAQLLYNDNRVKQHFNLDAWVCVSKEFDLHTITKTILEAMTSATCDINIKDLNRLQVTLKEKLTEKEILLVLDEVWNMNYCDWEVLRNPFKFVAQGSRVIVTTRDDSVASVIRANVTYYVKKLSEEDCWSIFAKHAFHDGNFDAHPELEALGRQIVKKCESLPLAAKAIRALLRSKLDADEWDKVLKSELWHLPMEETNILPALILSYKYLPSHLKRCFVYCSIFPKGYSFDKNELILLWMAEGFLQQPRIKTMEEIGDDYFMALVSRSLFQPYSGDKSRFVMHDLVSDLTKYVWPIYLKGRGLSGNCVQDVPFVLLHIKI